MCNKQASNAATAALERLSALSEKTSRGDRAIPPLFHVDKRASGIPGAGDGAFVTGRARRGEVVSFYRGGVYAPITGRIQLLFKALGSRIVGYEAGLSYTYCLPSDFLILGDPSGMSSSTMGSLLNHPTEGTQPNCVFYRATLDKDQLSTGALEQLEAKVVALVAQIRSAKR
jgi:hypothetical protein